MKKSVALFLALILVLSAGAALAADSRVESVEYMGFGIVELDFSRDCDWYPSASISLADASGAEIPCEVVAGEADNCYLRAATLPEGGNVTLNFSLEGATQQIPFTAVTGTEYNIYADGTINPRVENERCDFCGQSGHDEDFCPERIDAAQIPADADGVARMFDLDRCERCGGIGHDDDHCDGSGHYAEHHGEHHD